MGFSNQSLELIGSMIKIILSKIYIREFCYAILSLITTLILFLPFYFLNLMPKSNVLCIFLWLFLSDLPFLFYTSIFARNRILLSGKEKMISFVLLNSILVIIASITLINANHDSLSLEVFLLFIAIQSFAASIIKT